MLDFYDEINNNNTAAMQQWIIGVAVNMSPCHGEDHGFDSRMIRHFFIKNRIIRNQPYDRHQRWPGSSAGRAMD